MTMRPVQHAQQPPTHMRLEPQYAALTADVLTQSARDGAETARLGNIDKTRPRPWATPLSMLSVAGKIQ